MSRRRAGRAAAGIAAVAMAAALAAGGCTKHRIETVIKVNNGFTQPSDLYLNGVYHETVEPQAEAEMRVHEGAYEVTASTSSTAVSLNKDTIYIVLSIDANGDLQRP
jgi:hypothetical protein